MTLLHVRDVMTSPAVTVSPDDDLTTAARLLDAHGVTALPVVNDHGHIVGMVTETEVVRDAVPRDPWLRELHPSGSGAVRVRDVMSIHPVAVLPDVELPVAADLLVNSTLTSLPVVEEGVVVGVVSRHDIVAVLAHPSDQPVDKTAEGS